MRSSRPSPTSSRRSCGSGAPLEFFAPKADVFSLAQLQSLGEPRGLLLSFFVEKHPNWFWLRSGSSTLFLFRNPCPGSGTPLAAGTGACPLGFAPQLRKPQDVWCTATFSVQVATLVLSGKTALFEVQGRDMKLNLNSSLYFSAFSTGGPPNRRRTRCRPGRWESLRCSCDPRSARSERVVPRQWLVEMGSMDFGFTLRLFL